LLKATLAQCLWTSYFIDKTSLQEAKASFDPDERHNEVVEALTNAFASQNIQP